MMYFTDIWTLPLYNWFKVLTENNFGFLHVDSVNKSPKKVKQDNTQEAINLWFELNDQFTDEFGQDEQSIDLLEKKRDLGILISEFIESGNKFKLTQIEIKKLDLERFEKEESFNPNKELGIIGKHLGKPIDTRKTTVHQYYTIKESLRNG